MEKQFLCDECGVLFSHKRSLLRHVKNIHRGMKRRDNEKIKAANEKRKRLKIAEKILLSNSDVKEVLMKSNPTEAICFHSVRNTPRTEDMKRKAEESFEEIIRAFNKTFVFVEYESRGENVTDEAKLVLTDELRSTRVLPFNSTSCVTAEQSVVVIFEKIRKNVNG